MSEVEAPTAQITIRALKFWHEYKPDANGEMQAEEWVAYCAPGNAAFTIIEDAVRRVQRDKTGKWNSIKAAYEAWKQGSEIPEEGTPIGAWPGCTQAQAEILRANGIRSVEEVANLTETLLNRIKLPNPRALKDQAVRFLEARSTSSVEAAIKQRDEEIALLRAQMEDLMSLVAKPQDDSEDAPKRSRKAA